MYNFFDSIVCITLQSRVDRQQAASKMFQEVGIPVQFYKASLSPKGGRFGCFESHVTVIQQAYEKGYNHILIFEDDAIPTKAYSNELLRDAVAFMKSRRDWDVFYLGYIALTYDMSLLTCSKVTPHIAQFNPYATHAYCLSRTGMLRVLSTYQDYINNMHIDIYYANVFGRRSYCIVPMLFSQDFEMQGNVEACNTLEAVLRRAMDVHNKMRPLEHLSTFIYYRELIVYVTCAVFAVTLLFAIFMLKH